MQNCFLTVHADFFFKLQVMFFKNSGYMSRQKTYFGSINLTSSLLMMLKHRSSKSDIKQSKQRAGYFSQCVGTATERKRNPIHTAQQMCAPSLYLA